MSGLMEGWDGIEIGGDELVFMTFVLFLTETFALARVVFLVMRSSSLL